MKKIMLIPLDNRPCCSIFPEKIANIAGFEILKPPSEMLGEFLVPGNCDGIKKWMLEHADEVYGIVVACDMLVYGGLVASRDINTSFEEALERLEVLKEIKKKFPQKPLYAQSILMRISITARNREYAKYWKDIIEYSVLLDKVERLGMEELRNNLEAIAGEIPHDILETYFEARKRNHRINLEMINLVKEGIVDFLTITQEDCATYGPHVKEQQTLMDKIYQNTIYEKVVIYPGADEGTQTLIMKMILKFYGIRPKFYQVFSSINGQNVIAEHEDRPIGETLKCNIFALGGLDVDDICEADMVVMVNTPVCEEGVQAKSKNYAFFNPRHNLWNFMQKINYYSNEKQIPVALADVAFCNASDVELVEYLLKSTDILQLYGYAGWNTCGNTIGTAISMACARMCMQRYGDERNLKVFIEFLLERLMDEWAYQANIRTALYEYVEKNGVSPLNLGNLHSKAEEVLTELAWPYIKEIKDIFEGRQVVYRSKKYEIKNITCSYSLPWNRAFECKVQVGTELRTIL